MKEITRDTKWGDIEHIEPYAKYLLYQCFPAEYTTQMSVHKIHEEFPTWDMDAMIKGLAYFRKIADKQKIMYDVYDPTEWISEPKKEDVKLFFFPADEQSSEKPFILCISGGGYQCVCSVPEAFPTAARFNQLGYNVFVLNYRVKDGEETLFPKPLDDIAAALKFIINKKEMFGLCNTDYVVNGFSAGAIMTVLFGTEKFGYAKYELPQPLALFPVYPALGTTSEYMPDEKARQQIREYMFGIGYDEALADAYNVPENVTEKYPPCYIVHAKDDPVVNYKNSVKLYEILQEQNIHARLELAEFGGHGWGNGDGSGAAGWPDRASYYLTNVITRR